MFDESFVTSTLEYQYRENDKDRNDLKMSHKYDIPVDYKHGIYEDDKQDEDSS